MYFISDGFRSWFMGRAQGTGISCPAPLRIFIYIQVLSVAEKASLLLRGGLLRLLPPD